ALRLDRGDRLARGIAIDDPEDDRKVHECGVDLRRAWTVEERLLGDVGEPGLDQRIELADGRVVELLVVDRRAVPDLTAQPVRMVLGRLELDETIERLERERAQLERQVERIVPGALREIWPPVVWRPTDGREQIPGLREVQHLLRGDEVELGGPFARALLIVPA